jgi:hypothetical protein
VKKAFVSRIELKWVMWVPNIDTSKEVWKIVRMDFFVKILLVPRRLDEHFSLSSIIKIKVKNNQELEFLPGRKHHF